MTREISLTKGKIALVDDEDYEYLSQYKWYYHVHGYAVRSFFRHRRPDIYMHLEIARKKGLYVKHMNGNKLDNRKANMELMTKQQLQFLTRKHSKNNTSGFRGVFRNGSGWRATITCSKVL